MLQRLFLMWEEEDATDSRTRRFSNVGNSCYINATLQALFSLPPVQQLYEQGPLSTASSHGYIRDDGRFDGDLCIAAVYREARSTSKMSEPTLPQSLLDFLYWGARRCCHTVL